MNINKATKQFKETIIDSVNKSNLPAVNVMYVLKDVFSLVENSYNQSLLEIENEDEFEEETTE